MRSPGSVIGSRLVERRPKTDSSRVSTSASGWPLTSISRSCTRFAPVSGLGRGGRLSRGGLPPGLPPGRSRRFDARFFLIDADAIAGDPDDFSAASGELSHLHWIGTGEARALDLPFITEVVLAELAAIVAGTAGDGVPFFDNSGAVPTFRRLR